MTHPMFKNEFEVAKVANFNEKQLDAYEQSLKEYRDYHNTMDSAIKSAVKVAVKDALSEQKKETIIRNLKRGKMTVDEIAEDNEVSLELVLQIRDEIKKF